MVRWAIIVVNVFFCCFREVHSSETSKINSQQCGEAFDCTTSRIAGGGMISRCAVPWIVRLEVAIGEKIKRRCGGTIITDRLILTAAHCVYDQNHSTNAIDIYIDPMYKLDGLRRRALRVAVHPDYEVQFHADADGFNFVYLNDIALIEVEKKIKFHSSWCMPVCLPDSDDTPVVHNYMIAGYGQTSERGRLPKILRAAHVHLMPDAECEEEIRQSVGKRIASESLLCIDNIGQGFCAGDTGGPLLGVTDDYRWEQVGIMSFNFGCGHSFGPGVFTRVSYFMPWLQHQLMSKKNWMGVGGATWEDYTT